MLFQECSNVNEVKQLFKKLAFQYHPDRHPQEEFEQWNTLTRDLIAEYHEALEGRHGETSQGSDGRDHTYYYNEARESAVADKIKETIAANLPDAVTVWLIGTWIWLEGTSKDDQETRDKLTAMGYRWHGKRKKWYWRQGKYRSRRSNHDFDTLKSIYGAEKIKDVKERERLGA